jgi:chromosome segregation ATPase
VDEPDRTRKVEVMSKLLSLKTLGIVGVVLLSIVTRVMAGQDQSLGSGTLNQLLAEVRHLRSEVTSASATSIRAQVLVGRLQLEEQRITALGRQLADVQGAVAGLEQNQEGATARMKVLQDGRVAPDQREGQERELEMIAAAVEQDTRRLADLRMQQSALQAQLDQAQARWQEFNARLDELEQSLGK